QPPLSDLSAGCQPDLVGPPTEPVAASATLSRHLHAAFWFASARTAAPAHNLHVALSRLRRSAPAASRRSALPRRTDWHAGRGAAALKYLAPYIFRVALANNRIVGVQDDRVTFRYRDGTTKQMRTTTLSAFAFIGRFMQHVLPKDFVNVRYYGLFRLGNRR